jgi:hypothetical protein
LTYRRNEEKNFELYDIENNIHGKAYDGTIDDIWLFVPTPFKKGDIITDGEKKAVIKWVCDKEKEVIKSGKNGNRDSSDMNYYCYIIDYYNLDNKKIYLDAMSGYDGFEYYTEELKGFDRILKAISSLITNEIDLMLFLNAYNYLKAEDTAKEEIYNFGLFTDEGLRMAGLNRKDFDRKNKKL